MTREEFIEIMKTEIRNFSGFWSICQDMYGEKDWPEKLPNLSDWFEQFEVWFEEQND